MSLLSMSIREQARAAAWDHSSGRRGEGVDGPPELLCEHCPTPTARGPVSVEPPGLRLRGALRQRDNQNSCRLGPPPAIPPGASRLSPPAFQSSARPSPTLPGLPPSAQAQASVLGEAGFPTRMAGTSFWTRQEEGDQGPRGGKGDMPEPLCTGLSTWKPWGPRREHSSPLHPPRSPCRVQASAPLTPTERRELFSRVWG